MKQKPTYQELAERVKSLEFVNKHLMEAEQACSLNEARLQSLIEIFQHPAEFVQDILEFALEEAISLTGSKIGYLYHYDQEKNVFILNNWSKGAMTACAITRPQTVYGLADTGLWGEVVRQGRPIVVNDYNAPNPLKKGYPEGHADIRKYMTVPVINENRIVAVVGVANKDTDYTYSDVLHLTLLMDSVWKIVERKAAENALRNSAELLRKTQEIARVGSWELDIKSGVLIWSDQVYRIFGMDDSVCPVTYEDFLEAVHPDDRRYVDRAFKESITAGNDNYELEHRVIRKDTKEIRYVHEKCEHQKDDSGKIVRSVGMVADVTARKHVEERLRKFNEELERQVLERTSQLKMRTRQLQRLALALSQAEDRVQEKISHVLHEDLQQMLASARLHLDIIIDDTENTAHKNILIEKTRQLLQESLKKTRDLSHDLSPPILSHAGLEEALGWLARRMHDQHRMELTLVTDGFQRPRSKTIERFLFKTARELLFNVIKHAGVASASLTLYSSKEGAHMIVEDQGCGFDPSRIAPEDIGMGIYSIRERIDFLGGRIDIDSAPGRGTRSVIFIPDTDVRRSMRR
mgnify:CR=1 FL=1